MDAKLPTVLLTRPRIASERLAEELRVRAGADLDIIIAPVVRIQRIASNIDVSSCGGVIFTSANAVGSARASPNITAYCVGDATRDTAEAHGFEAISADGDADELVRLILSREHSRPLLHLRGEHGKPVVERLRAAGLKAEERIVYRQYADPISDEVLADLDGLQRVVAPVYSPRSSELLRTQIAPRPGLTIIAISNAAAAPWGQGTRVAQRPTAASMIDAVEAALHSDSH